MNTTKFRGQILNGPRKGEWVYGYYLYSEVEEIHYIATSAFEHGFTEVDPNTVGQYIGKKDKKEREIYSDDIYIIRYYLEDDEEDYDNKYLVKYDDFSDCCVNGIGYSFGEHGSPADIEQIEIIGNLTDNPDLLTQ